MVRGALSGAVAGLAAFIFTRIFAEPVISDAIDYESGRDAAEHAQHHAAQHAEAAHAAAHSHSGGSEVFSRTVQMNAGVGVGLVLFGAAMGALVAVGYVIAVGRVGRVRPFALALLLPAFYFVGVFAVPFLKYPANPPAIGHEETIRVRGALYLGLVLISCAGLFLAVYFGQKLYRRLSLYQSVLLAGLGYSVLMAIVFFVLPEFGHLHDNVVDYGRHATETPLPMRDSHGTIVYPGFPADLLAKFRVYSVINQLILWGGIALIFAPQARRLLDPGAADAAKRARLVEERSTVAV